MAARLALSRADVTYPDGKAESVTAVVRNNVLKITDRKTGHTLVELAGVTAVEVVRRNRAWTVRFDNGTSVEVERSRRDCGCG